MNRYFIHIVVLLFSFLSFQSALGQGNMSFIENKGQWMSDIQFKSELSFGDIYFENNNFTFILIENEEHNHDSGTYKEESKKKVQGHHFKIKFLNANSDVSFTEENKSGNYYNYFLGNDHNKWASGVHSYKTITYHNLYNGIDMKVKGEEDNMKYEYYLAPNANPEDILVQYVGLDKIALKNGNLVYKTKIAGITELKPIVYQFINEKKVFIECEYALDKNNKTVQFNLIDNYDHSKELIIDPTLIFASYTGSTLNNFGYTATYDNDGNLFGGGIYFGSNAGLTGYPSVNSFNVNDVTQGSIAANNIQGLLSDMAITKFSSDGSTLLYSTLIGGNHNEQPQSLVTDTAGNLFIYGRSYSTNFPISATAYDNSHNGNSDIVVIKISADGLTLLGSTFVGGSNDDGVNMDPNPSSSSYGVLKYNYADDGRGEIILDENGNVYVASTTQSSDFPVTAPSFQSAFGGGVQDACIVNLSSDLSSLVWASYLGGTQADAGYSLKLDALGNLFVTGGTISGSFPGSALGLNNTYLGGQADGYVSKMSSDGITLFRSSYIGTNSYDQSYFVEIDEFNDIYLYGQTTGPYPVTSNVYSNNNGTQFIHKLTNNLDTTIFSTVFGSGGTMKVNISPTAFLVDNCSNIYVSGWGGSSNVSGNPNETKTTTGMSVTPNAFQTTTDGSDFYFMVLNKNAETLLYATFYGGNQNITGGSGEHVDGGTSRFDKNGIIYQAVCASCGSNNNNFPTTAGAWSTIDGTTTGCNLGVIKMDVYIAPTIIDINANPTASGCIPFTVNFQSSLTNVNKITWDFGDGFISNIEDPIHTFTDTGTYLVRLIGQDTTLCDLADTAYLTIVAGDDPLDSNFLNDIVINCDSNSVSLVSYNDTTAQYLWTMGDGNSYTSDSVYHIYTNPGTYTINFTVADSTSCELIDNAQTQITIIPHIELSAIVSDSSGCIPLAVQFAASLNVTVDSFSWEFGDGTNSTSQSVVHNYTSAGNYTAIAYAIDSSTCNIFDSISFPITTTDDFATADITIANTLFNCDSMVVNAHSNSLFGSHFWNFGDGTTDTGNIVQHTYAIEGFYDITYIYYDSSKFCSHYDTVITTFRFETLEANINISDTFGCIPFELNYNTIDAQNYLWKFGNGDSSILKNGVYTYNTVDTFSITLIIEDSTTCNIIDTAEAIFISSDTRVISDFDIDILSDCDSLLKILLLNNSTNGMFYTWIVDGFEPDFLTNDSIIINFNEIGVHEIQLIVRNDALCNPLDTMTKRVVLLPNVVAEFEIFNNCRSFEINLNNQSSLGEEFFWEFGNGSFSNMENPILTYSESGDYTVKLQVIDSNSCNIIDSTEHLVSIIDETIAKFETDSSIYYYLDDVTFTNLSLNYNRFLWEFGDGITNVIDENPIYNYKIIDKVTPCLTVYNEYCQDSVCQDIFIEFEELIGVPNAFSPNGDGVNDILYVEGVGVTVLNFQIYNRWGALVFETSDIKKGWDGTFNGTPLELEVYTYILNATFINDVDITLKGNITLLR